VKTKDILNEREKTHGDYKSTSMLSWAFKRTLRESLVAQEKEMRRNMDIGQQEAIEMILHKIARIVCGDPNFDDHWDDIAGYAMLAKGKKIEPQEENDKMEMKEPPTVSAWFGCDRCGKWRREKDCKECAQGEKEEPESFWCVGCADTIDGHSKANAFLMNYGVAYNCKECADRLVREISS